jgi:23S rRNA pseudouridine2605 synthase
VNSVLAEIGQSVSDKDIIIFDGKLINLNSDKVLPRILIYNKPEGEIVSESDPKGRATVFDHLPQIQNAKWISIGRLDFNTSGLLIFTSYGEFANRLMHPRYEIEREYSVRVLGKLTDNQISQLRAGIKLEDGIAKFETISFGGGEGSNHWYQVTLKEGRNREVRRLFEFFNITVSRLMRIRFGGIILPSNLKKGNYIELSEKEVLNILSKFNMNDVKFNKNRTTNVKKGRR